MQMAVKLTEGHRLLAKLGLATADMNLGKYEDAAEIYREQIKRSPNRAFLHGGLAAALKGMGKSEEAEKELAIQKSLH